MGGRWALLLWALWTSAWWATAAAAATMTAAVATSSSSSSMVRVSTITPEEERPPPKPLVVVQALKPQGLRVAIEDYPGMELVLFNGNLNLPIEENVQRGQLSGNVLEAKDGFWTLQWPEINIKTGDILFYWIHVRVNGQGHTYPSDIAKFLSRVPENCLPTITTVNGKTTCHGTLLLEENFNALDTNLWKHAIQFPNSTYPYFSIYTASLENSFIEKGVLHIRPSQVPDDVVNGQLTLEGCTAQTETRDCTRRAAAWDVLPAVYSAWLRSHFTFRYGKLEIRARLARGDWLFNNIWLERVDAPFGDNVRETARVNLAWLRGNAKLLTDGNTENVGARHLFPHVVLGHCFRKLTLGHDADLQGDGLWTDDFHTYGVIWSPDGVEFVIDGRTVYTLKAPDEGFTSMSHFDDCPKTKRGKTAPLDQEMNINIALHVGGVLEFPTGSVSQEHPKPWKERDPKANLNFWKDKSNWLPSWSPENAQMKIDWIKLWAL